MNLSSEGLTTKEANEFSQQLNVYNTYPII